MPEDTKPVQGDKKPEAKKMVPESDFLAFKNASLAREKRLKEELATSREEVAQVKSELQMAGVDTENDEEVDKVRKMLIKEDKELRAERAKLDTDRASFKEERREAEIQTLATKYGVDVDVIKDEDDPKAKALEMYAERLAEEKKTLEESSPGSVYETGTPGTVRTQPKDMSAEEFDTHVKKLKLEASQRK